MGLQKIVYFNWGQRAEKFEDHCPRQSVKATEDGEVRAHFLINITLQVYSLKNKNRYLSI